MKLWDKGLSLDKNIEEFTVGKDRELDLILAKYDIQGSISHVEMLNSIGMLTEEEKDLLIEGLKTILRSVESGEFIIEEGCEDVHSQIEMMLIADLGEIGKKIHLARSRNDQVLLDLKLYFKDVLRDLMESAAEIVTICMDRAMQHKDALMPGYTHMQVAMVSSYGLWFSGIAESILDDMEYVLATIDCIDKNPLGTAAGYGSSMPIDRELTTKSLGFKSLCINPINAQINRGKTEWMIANAISSLGISINKLSSDICLYSNENYRFFKLPKEYTTGSSIMPHKHNPDVMELIRAKSNQLMTLPNQIVMLLSNLNTGYHRDFQLLKELLFPAIQIATSILDLSKQVLGKITINENLLEDDRYKYLFSVEKVNKYVLDGLSFRDAYRKVGAEIEAESFSSHHQASYTHIGSIGNLGLEKMKKRLGDYLNRI